MAGHINPGREQFDAFKELPRDEPINMLNLLRFRDLAAYPEGHEHAGKGWSGRRAYAEYGKTGGKVFARVGGTLVWHGVFETMVIGPGGEYWHSGFVAMYPNAAAFLEMIADAEYQSGAINRTAAVEDSRLVRFKPGEAGGAFR